MKEYLEQLRERNDWLEKNCKYSNQNNLDNNENNDDENIETDSEDNNLQDLLLLSQQGGGLDCNIIEPPLPIGVNKLDIMKSQNSLIPELSSQLDSSLESNSNTLLSNNLQTSNNPQIFVSNTPSNLQSPKPILLLSNKQSIQPLIPFYKNIKKPLLPNVTPFNMINQDVKPDLLIIGGKDSPKDNNDISKNKISSPKKVISKANLESIKETTVDKSKRKGGFNPNTIGDFVRDWNSIELKPYNLFLFENKGINSYSNIYQFINSKKENKESNLKKRVKNLIGCKQMKYRGKKNILERIYSF